MIKFVYVGLTVALITVGCSAVSPPPVVTAATTPQHAVIHPNETPSQPVSNPNPQGCPNLVNDYPGTGRNPELVIFYGNNSFKTFPIQQVDEALNFYFSNKRPEQPLLLYLHGRALRKTNVGDYDREPNESRTDVIPELSTKYHAGTVLMLHWPHKKTDKKGYPEADAKFSGKALVCVIRRLNSNNFNANKFPGFRALISHSMGALVLQEALNNSSENLHEFDVVAIFAAASRADDSGTWLSKIQADKRYVFINTHDIVLKQVKDRMHFVPLGRCDSTCFRANQPIQSMSYLDITDIAGSLGNIRHNYFVDGKVADKIVTKILKGELPPRGVQGISENVRIIRKRDISGN